ncbi:MAG: DUF4421 family protein [Crocinitomicaceae bacterium]|nr:DUF4421 family protein [Crocinitomicaceae bacterium]
MFGQAQDSKPDTTEFYNSYRKNLVVYTDLGYATSPFNIKFNSTKTDISKLHYKNNLGLIMGIGAAYKWISFRIGFALSKNLRSVEKYGQTSYLDIGFEFPIRKLHFDVDFKNYKGYAIKNAFLWNSSLNEQNKHLISPNINATSFVVNTYYINNKKFKISYLKGQTGYYKQEVHTWYIKSSIGLQGVSNIGSLIPLPLTDSLNSKTRTTSMSSLEIGALPGYAYVNRYQNWQYAVMFGIGPMIQTKFYVIKSNTRGFIGLAPRYDFRLIGGYNVPKWFAMISAELDNKSIRFNDLRYRNNSYTISIVAGMRFEAPKKMDQIKLFDRF